MKKNREFREKQYQERRKKDMEEVLSRDAVVYKQKREEIEAQVRDLLMIIEILNCIYTFKKVQFMLHCLHFFFFF